MEKKSLKKNVLLNTIRIILNIIFPMVTIPYAFRVIGPEKIGVINFSFAVISYFVMIMMLGLPMYGIRSIAEVKDDNEKFPKHHKSYFLLIL